MDEYLMYEAFSRGDYIPQEQIKKVTNFICGQLISWSPNRTFYQGEHNLATKLIIVCLWKKKKGLLAIAKRGQTICNNELVNFFEDEKTQKLFLFNTLKFIIEQFFMGNDYTIFYVKLYFVIMESVALSPNKKIKPIHWSFFTSIVQMKLLFSSN